LEAAPGSTGRGFASRAVKEKGNKKLEKVKSCKKDTVTRRPTGAGVRQESKNRERRKICVFKKKKTIKRRKAKALSQTARALASRAARSSGRGGGKSRLRGGVKKLVYPARTGSKKGERLRGLEKSATNKREKRNIFVRQKRSPEQ